MAPDSIAWFFEGPGPALASNGDLVRADGSLDPSYAGRGACLIGWQAAAPLRQPGGLIAWSFEQLLADLGYMGAYRSIEQLQELRP
ncbi:hypothetical protein D3C79_606650 [compost metagenome]